ncbi:Peroxisome biosynthesis protein pex1, partial [Coemansia furcata]
MAVLPEEKFTSGIDEIIQRDFFPQAKIAKLGEERQRPRQSSESLEAYLHTHTSEDNARFQQMMGSDRRRRDERYNHVFGSGKGRSHSRSGFLLDPPTAVASCVAGSSRRIVPSNTRLPTQSLGLGSEGGSEYDESVAGTPVINGYYMLRDPVGFKLAAPSPRELIALRLGKRPTQAAVVRASNMRSPLSPAALRLLEFACTLGVGTRSATSQQGWSGGVSQSSEHRDRTGALASDVLEIDSVFGRQLGVADGDSVSVSYVADVGTCTATEVEPASADDWEILSLNAGAVEERLLQQARVVAVGQPIVFWLSASTVVRLNTASVTPKTHACCLLANDSEVIVAPRTRRKAAATTETSAKQDVAATSQRNIVCCMRVAAEGTVAEGVVYANAESAVVQHMSTSTLRNVRIGRATPRESSDGGDDTTADSPKYADQILARLEVSDDVQPGALLASPAMLRAAGLAVGEIVRVQPVSTVADTIAPIAPSKAEDEVLVAGVGAFVDEAWQNIDAALAAGGSGGGLLVCGRRGSGKSSIARALAAHAVAAQGTRLVYTRHVDCAALALEPRVGRVIATLRAAVREARASAPALLVLDDVDALVEAASEHGDERRARRLAEALVDALVGAGGVTVLGTAAGRASIHARVLGAGVFAAVREIPAPRAAERELMLAAIAQASAAPPAPGASFAAAAYATEGYAPADLRALY